jgi:hypothetical protein
MSVGFHPATRPTRSGDRIKLKVERDREIKLQPATSASPAAAFGNTLK